MTGRRARAAGCASETSGVDEILAEDTAMALSNHKSLTVVNDKKGLMDISSC